MVERHYDEEALIAIMESDRVRTDRHIPSCPSCSAKLESFRSLAAVLRDQDVWDAHAIASEPVPETIANLRAFADGMFAQDKAAALILPELLAGTRDQWMPRLRSHPEWRTPGVVRALVAATTDVLMTMPPDALEMTALSVEIADHLDPAHARSATVPRLRATAWRDRGFALYYVGRFAESITACDNAARLLDQCVVDEYDRARVGVVRALSLRAMEQFTDAFAAVRESGETFERYSDLTRLVSSRIAETHLHFSRGDYATAESVLADLERQLSGTSDAAGHARVLANLGYCYWKTGRHDQALTRYETAAVILSDLGIRTEAVRVRWNVAAVLASTGRTAEALDRYRLLQREFEELGMASEAAVNGLEMAELLLAGDEYAAVEAICRDAMRAFERAGTSYTTRALTALAYIQEAAQHRTVTPRLVKHVRSYLQRLPQDGALLFAPPPPEPSSPTSR
jgi:tetratricopeptide (TPR) repeat protein